MTASSVSARIDGFSRPPAAVSPWPSSRAGPIPSLAATLASATAFTTDLRSVGEASLGEVRVLLVDVIGDDPAEHRVAEELESFVRRRWW